MVDSVVVTASRPFPVEFHCTWKMAVMRRQWLDTGTVAIARYSCGIFGAKGSTLDRITRGRRCLAACEANDTDAPHSDVYPESEANQSFLGIRRR